MASDDEFFNLIGSQAETDPEMKRLMSSTEGILREQPPTEPREESNEQVPVAQFIAFKSGQTILQVGEDADPNMLLAALHHAANIIRERFDVDED